MNDKALSEFSQTIEAFASNSYHDAKCPFCGESGFDETNANGTEYGVEVGGGAKDDYIGLKCAHCGAIAQIRLRWLPKKREAKLDEELCVEHAEDGGYDTFSTSNLDEFEERIEDCSFDYHNAPCPVCGNTSFKDFGYPESDITDKDGLEYGEYMTVVCSSCSLRVEIYTTWALRRQKAMWISNKDELYEFE